MADLRTGYPWFWSVHTWLDGELPASPLPADDVAAFVLALRRIDPTDGPEPAGGRGKPLARRDRWVREALAHVDAPGAVELWEEAMVAPEWEANRRCGSTAISTARNVLARDGRLAAVLDWGSVGIGDPAVDVQVAWKLVSTRGARSLPRGCSMWTMRHWLRAQGWCVSQALIALGYYTPENNPAIHAEATRWLAEVLAS